MARLNDKLYNRVIEGKLALQEGDDLNGVTPKYEVESVESLSSEQIDSLKAGDIVVKKTGNQRHAYIVSYKENGQGICLTYTDASCVETVSYDKSGDEWVFNSKDVMPLKNVEDAQSGTIQDVLGLNSSGKLVKGTVSGGTQLYEHSFYVKVGTTFYQVKAILTTNVKMVIQGGPPRLKTSGIIVSLKIESNLVITDDASLQYCFAVSSSGVGSSIDINSGSIIEDPSVGRPYNITAL